MTPLFVTNMPDGLLLLYRHEADGIQLAGYRPPHVSPEFWTRHGSLEKPNEALAARRFTKIVDVAAALREELAK